MNNVITTLMELDSLYNTISGLNKIKDSVSLCKLSFKSRTIIKSLYEEDVFELVSTIVNISESSKYIIKNAEICIDYPCCNFYIDDLIIKYNIVMNHFQFRTGDNEYVLSKNDKIVGHVRYLWDQIESDIKEITISNLNRMFKDMNNLTKSKKDYILYK